MAKALSTDLRHRVIGAIARGMSCRQAAAHFGVSASSAIRWQAQQRALGHVTPRRQGGDRRSKRIEAHAAVILGEIATTPDLTLAELQARLDARGAHFGIGTIWRFFKRRQITLKKRPPMQPSSSAAM
jgi:transposase